MDQQQEATERISNGQNEANDAEFTVHELSITREQLALTLAELEQTHKESDDLRITANTEREMRSGLAREIEIVLMEAEEDAICLLLKQKEIINLQAKYGEYMEQSQQMRGIYGAYVDSYVKAEQEMMKEVSELQLTLIHAEVNWKTEVGIVRAKLQCKQEELVVVQSAFNGYHLAGRKLETKLEWVHVTLQQTEELVTVQTVVDKYCVSNRELESKMTQTNKRNEEIMAKNSQLDRDLQLACEELLILRKNDQKLNDLRMKVDILIKTKRRLEYEQDELKEKMRLLEATALDVQQKLEQAQEENIVLRREKKELQEQRASSIEQI